MLREIEQRARRSWTGALSFHVPGAAAPSRAYLFEGGVYALELSWYRPRVAERLRSAGIVDATRRAILDSALGRDGEPMEAARFCVEQGWLTAEHLGAIHGEYLLAGLGAVADVAVGIEVIDAAVTGQFCTLPIAFADLEVSLRLRAERSADSWHHSRPPERTSVERVQPLVEPDHQVPEVLALLSAVERPASLDAAAGSCGFTRAEGAYIVSALAAQGVVRLGSGTRPLTPQVPEALPAVPDGGGN